VSGGAAVLGWGPQVDESAVTWGLQAINVPQSRCSGRGVRVAVLDTGIAPNHPDFAGRSLTTETFVPNEAVDDRNGHGTHCAGTACGPQHPQRLPRYGVACDAELHVGKVLSNAGRGPDGGIVAGINWALTQGCRVISMSLGGRVAAGQPFSDVFEQAAQRVVQAGTVLIAAAGNDSRRGMGVIFPVSHPANCPSILAVAAVDQRLRVADFSNRGINPNGGQVDIAAPGRSVLSSAPPPTLYRRLDGTSMATPHVAGVAALTMEAQPGISASELIARLLQTARRLPEASTDVGAGVVQAP
jgi:subtilisin